MAETIIKIASSLGYSPLLLKRCLSKFSSSQLDSVAMMLTEECLLPSKLALLPHQREIMSKLLQGQRGIIAAFPMGSGKTITAIAASECLKRQAAMLGVQVHIYVIVPTSLIGNYKIELKKAGYLEDPKDVIITKTKFYNKIKAGEITNTTLKNYIVIYDEAHTLRTDYRCEFCSDLVMAVKGPQDDTMAETALLTIAAAWKVIGLTGTPVYNQPYDWINLWALATGKPPLTANEYYGLHSTSTERENLPGTNPEILRDVFAFYELPKDDFPRRVDVYDLIEMTPEYFRAYQALVAKYSSGFKKARKNSQSEDGGRNAFMVKLRMGMNKVKNFQGQTIVSPKVPEALNIIANAKGGVLVFSEFISQGLDTIKTSLNSSGTKWGEINGSVSAAKRDKIVEDYNNKRIKVIIITKAGGEGLNLRETSDIVLLESGWTTSLEEQVIARGIRKGSHRALSEEDREVKVHHLLLIIPGTEGQVANYLNLDTDLELNWVPADKQQQSTDLEAVSKLGADVYLKWYSNGKDMNNRDELAFLKKYGLVIS